MPVHSHKNQSTVSAGLPSLSSRCFPSYSPLCAIPIDQLRDPNIPRSKLLFRSSVSNNASNGWLLGRLPHCRRTM